MIQNWKDAKAIMETARDKKKGKPIANNTRLWEDWKGDYEIRLHGNVIIRINKEGMSLHDGGWKTVTTKARLNDWTPYHVYQKNWEWILRIGKKEYPFGKVRFIHNDARVETY